MTELAQLGDDTSPAADAYRARIRAHHGELYDQPAGLKAELDELAAADTAASDADLIAQIPYAAGLLGKAPAEIQEALYAALGIHCTFRADQKQVTIRAVLTDTTPGIITALLAATAADRDQAKRSPEPFDDPAGAGRPALYTITTRAV